MKNAPFSLIAVFNDTQMGFTGNTSIVVLLDKSGTDNEMQQLAAEFNQPATTYLWKGDKENQYHVRWFAPDAEIGLCGHGSLAALAYLSNNDELEADINLIYREGSITGRSVDTKLFMLTLESIPVLSEEKPSEILQRALGIPVSAHFKTSNKDIVLTRSENDVQSMKPDFSLLRQLKTFGYAVTAPGNNVDFVSRTLVPHVQQLEDPATGSSHAALAPFWSKKLNKETMVALQLSKRGGKFICEIKSGKVALTGSYKVLADGRIR